MRIKIGCDLVHIKKFKKSVSRGGHAFLSKIFTSRELAHSESLDTLAGMYAAKEAAMKAFEIPAGRWHEIEVTFREDGRPWLNLRETGGCVKHCDLSISHDGEYALAFACGLVEGERCNDS